MDLHERRHYEAQIDQFRRLINRTPRWYPSAEGVRPYAVIDSEGRVVFAIDGPWAPELHKFFASIRRDSLLPLLTVLEQAPGTTVEKAAVRFLGSLRLDQPAI